MGAYLNMVSGSYAERRQVPTTMPRRHGSHEFTPYLVLHLPLPGLYAGIRSRTRAQFLPDRGAGALFAPVPVGFPPAAKSWGYENSHQTGRKTRITITFIDFILKKNESSELYIFLCSKTSFVFQLNFYS